MSDGSVLCWGGNDDGQLGTGNVVSSSTPLEVTALSKSIKSLGLGDRHSCGLADDGTVSCWGANDDGQLGTGTNSPTTVPADVVGLTNVSQVCAGRDHSCAIEQGTVRCWGGNTYGQLGNGTNQDANQPEAVSLPVAATAIACGGEHSCARLQNTQVHCWGRNALVGGGGGQLGDGTFTDSSTPVTAVNLSFVEGVAAGAVHSCAWTDGGDAFCWGVNVNGQLGLGDNMSRTSATEIGALSGVTQIEGGNGHSCALANGMAMCWGANGSGQLGTGDQQQALIPQAVTSLGAAGELAVGAEHTCARTPDGAVWCWGANAAGQLGNGSTSPSSAPVQVALPR